MAILIDAGFFLAIHSRSDEHHERAMELVAEIARGRYGRPIVSDYLVAEILNFASRKVRSADELRFIFNEILGKTDEPWLEMAWIDRELFGRTVELFATLGMSRGLSFTDCTSIELAKTLGIDYIASFDGGFDGILPRLS